jgi:hypothetical protein
MNKRKIGRRSRGKQIYFKKKFITINRNFRNRKTLKIDKKPSLEIEIPNINHHRIEKIKDKTSFNKNKSFFKKCEICGLIYLNLLSMHITYKKIIINNKVIRKIKKIESLCIYCHRVKHLILLAENLQTQDDLLMDLCWLKSVNNYDNQQLVEYFTEIKNLYEVNKFSQAINFQIYEEYNFNQFYSKLNNQDLIKEKNINDQLYCYNEFSIKYLSESEKIFREIILRDRENRRRIFMNKEGLMKNKKEFCLMTQYLEKMSKQLNSVFILEYEWEVKIQNKIIGVGDLVITDGTNFYVSEIKFLNENQKVKKIKKLEEQIVRYTRFFYERKKEEGYYTKLFVKNFQDPKRHKIYGIKFTNEDQEIRCCYCIEDCIKSNSLKSTVIV